MGVDDGAVLPVLFTVVATQHAPLELGRDVDAMRRNAVWTLARIDNGFARNATQLALSDWDESVRQAAIHSAGLWRDRTSLGELKRTLASRSLRRAAAEALGRIGQEPQPLPNR